MKPGKCRLAALITAARAAGVLQASLIFVAFVPTALDNGRMRCSLPVSRSLSLRAG